MFLSFLHYPLEYLYHFVFILYLKCFSFTVFSNAMVLMCRAIVVALVFSELTNNVAVKKKYGLLTSVGSVRYYGDSVKWHLHL